jgi:predicted nucleic acid-binding protein
MLLDSSAWIAYYRNLELPFTEFVDELLVKDKPIYTSPLIIQEVLQGFANEKEYMKAYRSFLLYRNFALANQKKATIDAANIYRNCRKKGYTIRKPNDCMIALIALTYNLSLLHNDKDFENIAKLYPLKMVKI